MDRRFLVNRVAVRALRLLGRDALLDDRGHGAAVRALRLLGRDVLLDDGGHGVAVRALRLLGRDVLLDDGSFSYVENTPVRRAQVQKWRHPLDAVAFRVDNPASVGQAGVDRAPGRD